MDQQYIFTALVALVFASGYLYGQTSRLPKFLDKFVKRFGKSLPQLVSLGFTAYGYTYMIDWICFSGIVLGAITWMAMTFGMPSFNITGAIDTIRLRLPSIPTRSK